MGRLVENCLKSWGNYKYVILIFPTNETTVRCYGKVSNRHLAVLTKWWQGQYGKAEVWYYPVKTEHWMLFIILPVYGFLLSFSRPIISLWASWRIIPYTISVHYMGTANKHKQYILIQFLAKIRFIFWVCATMCSVY